MLGVTIHMDKSESNNKLKDSRKKSKKNDQFVYQPREIFKPKNHKDKNTGESFCMQILAYKDTSFMLVGETETNHVYGWGKNENGLLCNEKYQMLSSPTKIKTENKEHIIKIDVQQSHFMGYISKIEHEEDDSEIENSFSDEDDEEERKDLVVDLNAPSKLNQFDSKRRNSTTQSMQSGKTKSSRRSLSRRGGDRDQNQLIQYTDMIHKVQLDMIKIDHKLRK